LDALEKLHPTVLSSLHTASDWDHVTQDAKLKDWLRSHAIPAPQATVSGPLFQGTLVFARIIFARVNQPDFSMSLADTQTAVSYATLAVVPIQRYASQYGPSSVTVSPTVIPFTANLNGNSFIESELEGWVEQIAQIARSNNVINPCVVILHDRSLPATPIYTGHTNAYHSNTSDGTPFCYCLVFGQNLSVADNNHNFPNRPNDKVYAHILSHEIAEMVVDPLGRDDAALPDGLDQVILSRHTRARVVGNSSPTHRRTSRLPARTLKLAMPRRGLENAFSNARDQRRRPVLDRYCRYDLIGNIRHLLDEFRSVAAHVASPLSQRTPRIPSEVRAVTLPRSCMPLAFGVSSRSSQCFSRINMRSFFSSPLEVVGKGLKLTRNRSVGHGLGSAEQSLCCFKYSLPRGEIC
jgi:hypothetical protein